MLPMPRFPPRGPHGRLFPRFHGTIKALRLPAVPPAALRFLRAGGTTGSRSLSLPPPLRAATPGLGLVTRYPPPGKLPWRRQDLSSSWGTTIPVCPCSQTPAGRHASDRLRGRRMVSAGAKTRTPTMSNISRLNSMAFGLAVYVSRCWLPFTAQDSLPGAGQALLGGLSTRRVPAKVFNSLHVRCPPFPSFLTQCTTIAQIDTRTRARDTVVT